MSNEKADKIKTEIAKEIFSLKTDRPNLAIIILGEEHQYYEKIKHLEKEAKTVGVDTNLYICESKISEEEIINIIELLNNDEEIDAIYLQAPLGDNINFDHIVSRIKTRKDINFEEDFESADWELLEANVFKRSLEAYKEKINISLENEKEEYLQS